MMEERLSRASSPSGGSNISLGSGARLNHLGDERLGDATLKHSINRARTPPTKAKRIRFFRNGDKFYTGIVMAVTPERYRSFDSLTSDLTRALMSNVTLPSGVRTIFSMDGKKVQGVGDLEDGKCYVVSGLGEVFKKIDYSSSKVRRGSSLSGLPQSPASSTTISISTTPTNSNKQNNSIPSCVKAKIITLIRNGAKPRKIMRLLINKRNAASLDHIFEAITQTVKLDCGAVKKVYTLNAKLIVNIEQFFSNDDSIFLACGGEKLTSDDFELDTEEAKMVQGFKRSVASIKRYSGPPPVMPKKTGKRSINTTQVRTPSPNALLLPPPLRIHYTVGHVIGDGNFAVVRHCLHKQTGAEYAMKIIDKYKCQGKGIMLESEISILRMVCHPNIISFITEQETADQLFLVMELVKGGDLFDAIATVTKFPEDEASVMIRHLTSALAYLHSHNIVHRDVKPENLLVEMEGSHVKCLKLGDFGLAQYVKEPLYIVCGTPTYVAPEILDESGYGLKIDIWAAGVILYILLCGFPPFVSPENDQEELFELILRGQYEFTSPYWDSISNSAKQLISNMLQAQPELRFTAEDVLDHPWLVSFLGSERARRGTKSVNESSEQHRNQQCQSLKWTTDQSNNNKHQYLCDLNLQNDNKLPKKGRIVHKISLKRRRKKRICDGETSSELINNKQLSDLNGNDSSLINSQNINKLSLSMNSLFNNLNHYKKCSNCTTSLSSSSSTSSSPTNKTISTSPSSSSSSSSSSFCLNSILENVYLKNKSKMMINNTSKLHSNRKNGNYISNIHSNRRKNIKNLNEKKFLLNKCNNFNNNNIIIANDNVNNNKLLNKKYKKNNNTLKYMNKNDNINDLSQTSGTNSSSIECLSHLSSSSDNNIQTSNSFVNLKIINQRQCSNSSLESTGTFEDIYYVH